MELQFSIKHMISAGSLNQTYAGMSAKNKSRKTSVLLGSFIQSFLFGLYVHCLETLEALKPKKRVS